jgi:cell division protein ZapA (FtsZ GTPase activity inhibitor)
MIKYLWHKNKTLIVVSSVFVTIVLIMGTLIVVDELQKEAREANSISYELTEDDGEISAYNVEGLSDEEIEAWLESERSKKTNGGE